MSVCVHQAYGQSDTTSDRTKTHAHTHTKYINTNTHTYALQLIHVRRHPLWWSEPGPIELYRSYTHAFRASIRALYNSHEFRTKMWTFIIHTEPADEWKRYMPCNIRRQKESVSKNQLRHLLGIPFELFTIGESWNFRILKLSTWISFATIEFESKENYTQAIKKKLGHSNLKWKTPEKNELN